MALEIAAHAALKTDLAPHTGTEINPKVQPGQRGFQGGQLRLRPLPVSHAFPDGLEGNLQHGLADEMGDENGLAP